MWATADLIKQVGCDNVHLDCSSTDVAWVMNHYTEGGVDLAPARECLANKCGNPTQAQLVAIGDAESAAKEIPASLIVIVSVVSLVVVVGIGAMLSAHKPQVLEQAGGDSTAFTKWSNLDHAAGQTAVVSTL